MKQLKEYISEQFLIGGEEHVQMYDYHPTNKSELSDIIYGILVKDKNKEVIDLNNIDTSKIIDMSMLFYNLNIKKIDITYWETDRVKNMKNMFAGCVNLESVGDLSEWNVGKLTNAQNMFSFCKKLTDVGDLSSWNVSSNINTENMFKNSGITNVPTWA